MKMRYMMAAAAAVASIATAAYASVTFDATTGTGFVGKGDVQLAFGWNNQALQANAAGVTFSYNATDSYEAVCSFTTGEGTRGEQTHNIDHNRSVTVTSSIAYEARKQTGGLGQITGFNLTGLGATTESGGEVPVVGGACMGNEGHDGLWSSVNLVSSTGGLFVNHGGASVALPNTPAI
jgi:hypothetical protein